MRVAIYTRVSTDHQAEEGFSLEVQHEKLMEYITRHNLEFFAFYTDPGVSAKDLKRPGIQSLLRDFDAGLFDVILVHKLDRLTRNIGDLHNLVEMVNAKNKKLISYTEDIDTSTPSGRMFVYFLGVIAQLFRENLGEEVTKGMRKRASKGLHSITVDLYGYERTKDSSLKIKEDEAKWVRYIFEKYISGKGSRSIAVDLNSMGSRQNKGAKWDDRKVINVLRNKHYIGKVHWKGVRDLETTVSDGKHEAIISEEIFEKAQTILKRRSEGLISLNSHDYIFGGLIRCGKCGGRYKGKHNGQKDTGIRKMYTCTTREKYGTCDQSGLSERKLTDLVFNSIALIGKEYKRNDIPKETMNEEEEIRKAMRISEERRERWQMAYGDGNMPYEDFGRRMKEEMIQINKLEERLSTLPKQIVSKLTPEEAIKIIDELKTNWNYLDSSTHKEIMQSLFQKIVIIKNDKKWSIVSIDLA